jgi:hypothetical protein
MSQRGDDLGGGVLPAMLPRTDGRGIFRLPAWPKDWDVELKLMPPRADVTIADSK